MITPNKAKSLPELVFLHGWGSDAAVWSELNAQLPGKHHSWNLPGFGENTSSSSLDAYLENCINELPESCILIGWSLGGMVATRLALLAPQKVKGLITLASNASFVKSEAWPNAMPQTTFKEFLQQFETVPAKTFQRFCLLQTKGDANAKAALQKLKGYKPQVEQYQQWQQALAWLEALDNRTVIPQLVQPQLHLFAENDQLVPASVIGDFKNQLHIKGELIPNASHCLPLTAVNQCAKHILHFMQPWLVIDKHKIAQSFSGAATTYDSAAKVQQKVGKRLLQNIKQPLQGVWLDIGSGTGFLNRELDNEFHPELWLNGDIALGMLQNAKTKSEVGDSCWINMDAEQLPLAPHSLQGVMSSLTLQWVNNLPSVLRQCFNALKPGGECLIATCVDGTLGELQTAWQSVDDFTHVNSFLTQNAVERAFSGAGFVIETIKQESVVDEYPSLLPLLKSLKAIGAHNMNPGQKRGLTTKRQLQTLANSYEQFRNESELLPVTYKVIYVRAIKI